MNMRMKIYKDGIAKEANHQGIYTSSTAVAKSQTKHHQVMQRIARSNMPWIKYLKSIVVKSYRLRLLRRSSELAGTAFCLAVPRPGFEVAPPVVLAGDPAVVLSSGRSSSASPSVALISSSASSAREPRFRFFASVDRESVLALT